MKWKILALLTICVLGSKNINSGPGYFMVHRVCVDGYEYVMTDLDNDGSGIIQSKVALRNEKGWALKTCTCSEAQLKKRNWWSLKK